jgi:hypothetical protein
MLQNFYLSFYRILIDPRGDDPVRDFLAYHDFRSNIKQHSDEWKPEKWRDMFVAKDIGPPDRTSSLALPASGTGLAPDRPCGGPALDPGSASQNEPSRTAPRSAHRCP